MGLHKAIESKVLKVFIGPAMMIKASTQTFQFAALAENIAQPSANPLVQRFEGIPVTVLEVLKPASQSPI
jgi:hypothetical protein